MLVNTAVFGSLEVADEYIFNMSEGLYGFDQVGDFALIIRDDEDGTLMWYQPVEEQVPCFVVFNPFEIIDGYQPVLESADLRALGCGKGDELQFLVIAVVPEDISKITVNLKSPIAINPKNKRARQVILANKDYPIKFALVSEQSAVNA